MKPDVHTLDVAALEPWLARHVPGFAGPLTAEKFAGGQSNPTFLLNAASGRYVLRRKPPGALLASAHAVDREYRVLRALRDTPVPVATPRVLCTDEAVVGSMFYIMDYVPGRIFWDPALPELPRAQRRAVHEELVRVLAALHDVDVERVGLADYGRPGNYFERQLGRWSGQYRASETETLDDMEALMAWLPAHLPPDDGAVSLIHGDFRLDNFIFDAETPTVRAVLDWELSTLGHPFADLAYLCMCLRLPDDGFPRGLGAQSRAQLGVPEDEEIVALYCRLRNVEPPRDWTFHLAFAFFRLAAICQGVLKRALDGNASSTRALETGRQAKRLAALGAALIR